MAEPAALLRRILAGEEVPRADMESFIGDLMDGKVGEAVQAGVLVALAMRGEAVGEVAGAAAAMRSRALAVPHHRTDVVDTCGTGGDGKGTFNISTAAALIAAGAGVPIAKHGNRAISSRSGSADVLGALGVAVDLAPEAAARCLDDLGIAFLFAPRMHPAMRAVMTVRQALGVRTLFNVLGPLTNPAGARRQVLGVFAPTLVERLARVLGELDSEHVLVVHADDGLDELSTSGPNWVAELRDGEVHTWTLDARDLGFPRVPVAALAGGVPEENAAAMERLLDGEPGPLADVTLLNAGAAVYVGGRAVTLEEGIEQARQALASGAARRTLEALRRFGAESPGSEGAA
ncbi:MAG: anthranilate phosphoribosyltransferase [Thermoanaerobaculia bacterium]